MAKKSKGECHEGEGIGGEETGETEKIINTMVMIVMVRGLISLTVTWLLIDFRRTRLNCTK